MRLELLLMMLLLIFKTVLRTDFCVQLLRRLECPRICLHLFLK